MTQTRVTCGIYVGEVNRNNTFKHCVTIDTQGEFAEWWRGLLADGYGDGLDSFELSRIEHAAAMAYNKFGRNCR